jgi:hypothetical protein
MNPYARVAQHRPFQTTSTVDGSNSRSRAEATSSEPEISVLSSLTPHSLFHVKTSDPLKGVNFQVNLLKYKKLLKESISDGAKLFECDKSLLIDKYPLFEPIRYLWTLFI